MCVYAGETLGNAKEVIRNTLLCSKRYFNCDIFFYYLEKNSSKYEISYRVSFNIVRDDTVLFVHGKNRKM